MRPVGLDSIAFLQSSLPTGTRSPLAARNRSAEDIAKEFETLLVTQMIGAMREAGPKSGLLEASPERRLMDGAFDHELARSLVERGGLGVAESLVGNLGRLSGEVPPPPGTTSPLLGRVTSDFGARRDPLNGKMAFHGGIDVAAPRGTAIHAAASGVVTFADWRGNGGQLVEIAHNGGFRSRYAHADSLLVRAGERVEAGEAIATVGSTGRSTGPHLHFSVEHRGRLIDPGPWLDAGTKLAQNGDGHLKPRL